MAMAGTIFLIGSAGAWLARDPPNKLTKTSNYGPMWLIRDPKSTRTDPKRLQNGLPEIKTKRGVFGGAAPRR